MKNYLILFLLFPLLCWGHSDGHYHQGDFLKIWHLKNGKQIEGNFLFGKDDYINVEQLQGKIISIPITTLSNSDQKIAQINIRHYQHINKKPYSFNLPLEKFTPNSIFKERLLIFLMLLGVFFIFKHAHYESKISTSFGIVSVFLFLMWACKKEPVLNPNNTVSPTLIPKTSISFLDSTFSPFKKMVSTDYDENYYYVNSNGIPNHNMMVGITSWQQQVPIPQAYNGSNHWSIPLKPVYDSNPLSTKTNFMKGAVALAINGIPIFNALNNRGEDSFAIGELDQWGGHCGRADDYHYHAAPLHLNSVGSNKPIAFALDGFAVYGSKEPDGTPMRALDNYHGHEISNSVYHYHGTIDYPYVVGSMRGKVTIDPNTPAPENQIIPQAFANPVRPALTALKGAVITNFENISPNSYQLTYQLNGKKYSIKYSWVNNIYTFLFIDPDGNLTTETYTRK